MSWIVSLSYFVGQSIAQLAWKGPPFYSMISNAVSDLGVTSCGTVKIGGLPGYYCSPLYLAENAGFVITGVAIFLGVCLTRDVWPRSKSSYAGLVLLALAGVGKVAAGLSPANVDLTIHLLDIPGIVLGNIGMIMVGRALRVEARRVARFTEALGVIGMIGILGFLAGSHSGIAGLLERIGGYPLIIWAAAIGITLVARRNVATTASTDDDGQSRSQKTEVRANLKTFRMPSDTRNHTVTLLRCVVNSLFSSSVKILYSTELPVAIPNGSSGSQQKRISPCRQSSSLCSYTRAPN